MLLVLTGCGKKDSLIIEINNEGLTEQDVTAFAMMFIQERGLRSQVELEEQYDEENTYEQHYKALLHREVVEDYLLYYKARDEKIHMSKEQKKQKSEYLDSLENNFGKEWMKERNLERADLEKVYEIKCRAQRYLEEKTETVLSEEKTDGRYIHVKQALFMTALVHEDGMVVTDQDGNVEKEAPEKIEVAKQEAEQFAQQAAERETLDISVSGFQTRVNESENYYKYEDLEQNYKNAVDRIKEGEISRVIETKYGYCVAQLVESDAKEYGTILKNHDNQVVRELYNKTWIEEIKHEIAKEGGIIENQEYWQQLILGNYVVEFAQ